MRWNKAHFTGVDYDNASKTQGVWLLEGKKWAEDVDEELGNYDYLYIQNSSSSHKLQALIVPQNVCRH
jgi:alpha-amylase